MEETRRAAATSAVVIAVVASAAALYFARFFFVPLTIGVLIAGLLYPVVAGFERRRVPAPAGAAISVIAAFAFIVLLLAALGPPLGGFIAELPRAASAARERLTHVSRAVARIQAALSAPATARANAAAGPGAPPVTSRPPPPPARSAGAQGEGSLGGISVGLLSAAGRAFGATTGVVGMLVQELLLAFFLLAGGSRWREKLRRAVRPEREHAIASTPAEMRAVTSRYIVVTALINAGQGVVVGIVMWLVGLPSPLLWAILTFVLEFIPYLGGLVMIGLLLIAGLASGASLARTLLAPAAYLVVTTIQNNLVSPAAYGRDLRLDPAAIMLSLMFFWPLWGVAGAFLAVPLLAAFRILAARVEALRPVAAFLEY